jgi:hypothetical protein
LMEFARQEADQHLKSNQLRGLLKQAQDLMTRGSYREVVELLTPVSNDPAAASLLFLLEDARDKLQSLQREIDGSLQTVEVLTTQEQFAEAVKFLESQAPPVLHSASVQTALQRLREATATESAALQAVGKAYAALDRLETGAGNLLAPGANEEASLLSRIVPVFASRRKSAADRQLSSVIQQAQAAIDEGNRKQAAASLNAAKPFTAYASSSLQEEWQALLKKAEKGKMFGRRA